MILLALDTFDSDFMEEHCMEALERMGPEEAIDPMLQKANRRDQAAMAVLGKIGVDDEEVVDTLLDYVDSNPNLQQPAFRALGEIGTEDALEPIAQQLVADEADVPCVTAVKSNTPVEAIHEYVEEHDIDLVVMGKRGRSDPDKPLLGSITERTVGSLDVPVFTA